MTIKGTRTEKNLLASFAGESQARNRYGFFADKARKEGYEKIAAIFDETAEQERTHAKRFFAFLQGGDLEITASYPAGVVGTTLENLLASAGGEHHEQEVLYPEAARIAREEGFENVAKQFENTAVAERMHERRFQALAATLQEGHAFKSDTKATWTCRKCGFTHEGEDAPDFCPACSHPKAYFEILPTVW